MGEWRVLVVEDESDSLEMVQGILEFHGIQSVGVKTGEQALETLKSFTPSIVIIDLALPGMDGWVLLEQIKQIAGAASIRCVAITAYHSIPLQREALEAGFDAYFAKPLNPPAFIEAIEKLLFS